MVLTAYCVLTPERPGFVVSVAARAVYPRDLAPATGAPGLHVFAVRERCRTSDDTFSSIASRLTIVTTRSPLFIEAGHRYDNHDFPKIKSRIFFMPALDRIPV
jgi:hypothetical protein